MNENELTIIEKLSLAIDGADAQLYYTDIIEDFEGRSRPEKAVLLREYIYYISPADSASRRQVGIALLSWLKAIGVKL